MTAVVRFLTFTALLVWVCLAMAFAVSIAGFGDASAAFRRTAVFIAVASLLWVAGTWLLAKVTK